MRSPVWDCWKRLSLLRWWKRVPSTATQLTGTSHFPSMSRSSPPISTRKASHVPPLQTGNPNDDNNAEFPASTTDSFSINKSVRLPFLHSLCLFSFHVANMNLPNAQRTKQSSWLFDYTCNFPCTTTIALSHLFLHSCTLNSSSRVNCQLLSSSLQLGVLLEL